MLRYEKYGTHYVLIDGNFWSKWHLTFISVHEKRVLENCHGSFPSQVGVSPLRSPVPQNFEHNLETRAQMPECVRTRGILCKPVSQLNIGFRSI